MTVSDAEQSGPLRPSDLVERWHPGARVVMRTNALTSLSNANAVAWFDDDRDAARAIEDLRAEHLGVEHIDGRCSVMVLRSTRRSVSVDRASRLNALLESPSVRRHLTSLAAMWAMAFIVVAGISFDGPHAIAVASTVSFLIGAFGAAPVARAWRDSVDASSSHDDRIGQRLRAPRRLTMVTVITDDRAAARRVLDRWWGLATMCAIVDDRGRLC